MPMNNPIPVSDVQENFRSAFGAAMQAENTEEMMDAIQSYSEDLCTAMLADYQSLSYTERTDRSVLAARGVRQLTSQETAYYNSLITAMRASDVRSAIKGIEPAIPETIVDELLDNIRSEFPILDAVDFVNSSYLTRWLYNKGDVQLATWGPFGSDKAAELTAAIGSLDTTLCTLSAYLAVNKDYLELGPAWMDSYVRAVLTEACGTAFEEAVVAGKGSAAGMPCPVGMVCNMTTGSVSGDLVTYTAKEAVPVTEITPAGYGALVAPLTKGEGDRTRRLDGLTLICTPNDYLTKVMPATTILLPDGTYAHDVFPIATRVLTSTALTDGTAVLGLPKRYAAALGVGSSKTGFITCDDSVNFLQNCRVYRGRLLGNGKPKDNSSFLLLDISNLKPLTLPTGE